MSPIDLERLIYREPFKPLQLTPASGAPVIIDSPRHVLLTDTAIYHLLSGDPSSRIGNRVKIISVLNIVAAKTIATPPRQ